MAKPSACDVSANARSGEKRRILQEAEKCTCSPTPARTLEALRRSLLLQSQVEAVLSDDLKCLNKILKSLHGL
jgi:hypothetical protein